MGIEQRDVIIGNQKLTQAEKDANNKQYYKNQIDRIAARAFGTLMGYGNISEYTRKKVNYDLYNNIIDLNDLNYVCKPYGADAGELPAQMVNRDISSNKIKLILGMEMQRPFPWKAVATNYEATTRKEQLKSKMISEYVVNTIMLPIQQEIELQYAESLQNKQLTPEEKQKIQQQISDEIKSKTPDEVLKYMSREHQDPAEVLANQILNYIIQKENVKFKFNLGYKHATLAGEEIYWVSIINNKPVLRNVNPLYFDYERTHENQFVQDSSWAVYDLRLSVSDVITWFGEELTDEQIDRLYESFPYGGPNSIGQSVIDDTAYKHDGYTVRVLHCQWKGLKKIQFLKYISPETGEEEEMIVDETYKLNKKNGDISLKVEWIPETHEGFRIAHDIYVGCEPVKGQHKDLDNLYECKLSYYGGAYDALNSPVTSAMDRIKSFQYFYNIILYRIEMLMASDKGKILMMNINAIPKSAGIDIKKFLYYADSLKIGFYNPSEEGNKLSSGNVGEIAKEIDLSLASDINKYIQLADKIEYSSGTALGITPQMMGQLGPTDAVTNTKQSIMQSSYVLEPYFELHNVIKKDVLQALLENAKTAYTLNPPECLTYVLDDMSVQMLEFNDETVSLLSNSTYGIFVTDSSDAFNIKKTIESLAHAAVQNNNITLSDVIKVIKTSDIQAAEETLEIAETKRRNEINEVEKQKLQMQSEENERERNFIRETWEEQRKQIVLKEEERRKTIIQSDTVKAFGFNENKDMDNDGTPDILELAKHSLDTNIANADIILKRDALLHKQKDDAEKNEIARKKLELDSKKLNNSSKSK